jgi:hypothetical protein
MGLFLRRCANFINGERMGGSPIVGDAPKELLIILRKLNAQS